MTTDTKTALLDVAEQAARARGFDGFSYADLAEAVGIRKASIHYHFPTKATLSTALMTRYHADISGQFDAIEARSDTGADRLRGLIALYRDALNGGATLCLCVALTISRESLSPEVVTQLGQYRHMMITRIGTIFALGQRDGTIAGVSDTDAEARATLALLEGAHLGARAQEDATLYDQATQLLKARCGAG